LPAIQKSLIGLLLVLVFAMVADLMQDRIEWTTWANALLGVGAIIAVVEGMLFIVWLARWGAIQGEFRSAPPIGYRIAGLLTGHANVTSAYFNLLIPYILFKLTRKLSVKHILAWSIPLLAAGFIEYLASSRGGWISGGIGAGMLILYMVWDRFGSWERLLVFIRRHRKHFILFSVLCVVLLSSVGLLFIAQVRRTGHTIGVASRVPIWGPTVEIIQKRPLLGTGWGSFSTLFAQQTNIPPGFATSHAHNLFLQIWVEHGFLGVCILAIILFYLVRAFSSIWRSSNQTNRLYAAVAISSLATTGPHQLVDYLFESPLYTVGVLIWLAILYRLASDVRKFSIQRRYSLAPLAPLLVIAVIYSTVSLPGTFMYWRGISAFRSGNLIPASDEICAAAEKNPRFSLYQFECGISEAYKVWQHPSSGSIGKARDAILTGLTLDPYWPPHWVNLAVLEWTMGLKDNALQSIEHAIKLAPNNSRYQLFHGFILDSLGNTDAAYESYQLALWKDPWLAFSDYFKADIERKYISEEFRNTYQEIPQNGPWLAWNLADRGNLKDATSLFRIENSQQPTNSIVYAGLAYSSLLAGNLSDAITQIRIALFISPNVPLSLTVEREIEKALGHFSESANLSKEIQRSYYESSESWQYYNRTYLKFFISPDLVPQFYDALLSASK